MGHLATIDQIVTQRLPDSERLRAALSDLGADFDHAVVSRIGDDYGFGGALWAVETVTRSVVVKVEDADGMRRAVAAMETVAVRQPDLVPEVLDSWTDGEKGFLLLERVTDVEQGDVLVGAEKERLLRLIEGMATVHSIDPPALLPTSRLEPWGEDRWRDRVAGAVERFPEVVEPHRDWLLGAYPSLLDRALARLNTRPPVLLHGDLHTDNVLWRSSGHPVLLDWSGASSGPRSLDLASLLFGLGTAAADRAVAIDRYAGLTGVDRADFGPELEDARLLLLRGVVGFAGREQADRGTRWRRIRREAIERLLAELEHP